MALQFKNLLAMMRKPYFPVVPVFDPATNLGWIPDSPSADVTIAAIAPSESPDGVRTTFTWASTPQIAILNGTLQYEGEGWEEVSTGVIRFLDGSGVMVPSSTDSIRAIL